MGTARTDVRIRKAIPADIPFLQELIKSSVRELQKDDYSEAQRESAIRIVFGVDSQLIEDGTYFVAEVPGEGKQQVIAGCGGWSKRKTLFGADQWTNREDSLLDPASDAARIRAFFVHPAWARRGIGTLILEACETAAREAGFTRFEMGATLTGAKLFQLRGYVAIENIQVPLEDGMMLPVVRMEKRI